MLHCGLHGWVKLETARALVDRLSGPLRCRPMPQASRQLHGFGHLRGLAHDLAIYKLDRNVERMQRFNEQTKTAFHRDSSDK